MPDTEGVEDGAVLEHWLGKLTKTQLQAVEHPADGVLQILAGPGSGKTRTLTTRVAWLILKQGISAADLMIVTFTNKASREMKERLTLLLGKERVSNFGSMGTFHGVCNRLLRKHGNKIGLPADSILDGDDATKLVKEAAEWTYLRLENEEAHLIPNFKFLDKPKAKDIKAAISKLKARGLYPPEAMVEAKQGGVKADILVARIYVQYEVLKRAKNAVDFDDLILKGVELLRAHPKILAHVKHVLVDEIQDTSVKQYELVQLFARSSRAITTVGDTDQAIYSWREARRENVEVMRNDYGLPPDKAKADEQKKPKVESGKLTAEVKPEVKIEAKTEITEDNEGIDAAAGLNRINAAGPAPPKKKIKSDPPGAGGCTVIMLRESFRSTKTILDAAQRVIEQDKTREERVLQAIRPPNQHVSLLECDDEPNEAERIVQEIKRHMALTGGGLFTYDDYAILCRTRSLMPAIAIEKELTLNAIPSRLFGSIGFFDRAEIKDLMAYIQLAVNPAYDPAFTRVVNVPKRGIGEKTVDKIGSYAISEGMSYLQFAEEFVTGKVRPLELRGSKLLSGLRDFVTIVHNVRRLARAGTPIALIFKWLVGACDYASHIKGDKAEDARKGHIRDLLFFAAEAQDFHQRTTPIVTTGEVDSDADEEIEGGVIAPLFPSASLNKLLDKWEEGMNFTDEQKTLSVSHTFKKIAADTAEAIVQLAPLRDFVATTILSEDMAIGEVDSSPKVTISTCHRAKGLEWPVVFVAGAEDGTLPIIFAQTEEQMLEEQRILYVAMTRAMTSLYVTYARMRWPRNITAQFVGTPPEISLEHVEVMAKVLGREDRVPTAEKLQQCKTKYQKDLGREMGERKRAILLGGSPKK